MRPLGSLSLVGLVPRGRPDRLAVVGTVGKQALGMIVVEAAGERLTVGRYLARSPSSLILGNGFLMVGGTARRQGLHDIIAGTFVVQKASISRASVL